MFCAVLTNSVVVRINPAHVAYVAQLTKKSIIHFSSGEDIEVLDTIDGIENAMFDCQWRDMQESKEATP